MSESDVIITGIGVVCAIGQDKDSFWGALCNSTCGIGPVDLFDTSGYRSQMGAQVRGIDFFSRLPARQCRRLGRCDLLGLWAADEALREARILDRSLAPERVGVVLGAGSGGVREAEQYRRQLYEGRILPRPSLLMPFPACNLTDAMEIFTAFPESALQSPQLALPALLP